MTKSTKFSPEVRERAVRMVFDAKDQYESQWAAIVSIAGKIGCTPESLRRWIRQQERDTGQRGGSPGQGVGARSPRAEKGQRNSAASQCVFRAGGARPPHQVVNAFIDVHRDRLGVEPICRVLQVAPSAYRRQVARQNNPALRCKRALRDEQLGGDIDRIWQANHQVYGAAKVWRQLKREGQRVARCTVERLMRQLGLRGVTRGKAVRTTRPDPAAACPQDHVNRQFVADRPNQL